MMSALPICNASVVTFLMESRCQGATMMVWCRLSVKDFSWCKQWSLHTPTSSSRMATGKGFFSKLTNTSGTNVVHAATPNGKISSVVLSGPADSEDNVSIASTMFPLILSYPPSEACIPYNFLSSMVVHNALGGECRRARSRQRTCRSTW